MSHAVNRQIVLRARPGERVGAELFELREAPIPEPRDGELLIRVVYLSLDPAMRGWISEVRNYSEPVALGAVMRGFTVGEVTHSKHPDYRAGEIVLGAQGWQEHALSDGADIQRKVDAGLAPISTALGVLGHTGLTAWVGLMEIGAPRPGETVVVSTAAGAVGGVVGQLAKIQGCRAVGLTGTGAKVALCRDEFGYDACINYRAAADLGAALDQACPEGIDVYFDNVGGAILDAVLGRLNVGGRVAVCGTMSLPTAGAPPVGPRVERRLLVARARLQGFLVLDHLERAPEIVPKLARWLAEGRIRYREDVVDGLENAPATLVRLLAGENQGKQLIRVAPESS